MSTCPTPCQKTFIQQVRGLTTVTAYWTLDQATLNAFQLDSVGTAHLQPRSGVAGPGIAAKFSNGVQMNDAVNSGGNGGYDVSDPEFDYTAGQSFSFWGWFKILSAGIVPGFYGPYLTFYCFAFQQLMIELANTNFSGNLHIYDPRGPNDDYLTVSLNDWHFFHLFVDGSISRVGYSIDNGAEVLMTNLTSWQTSAGNGFILDCSALGGNPVSAIWDEIGVVMANKLTSSQVTYLYNSGAGRTWPITLP